MLSVRVLVNEKMLSQNIIMYKQENRYDKNLWEKKLGLIEKAIINALDTQKNDIKNYKNNIALELENEREMIEIIKEEKNTKSYERITKRIEIIEKELKDIEQNEKVIPKKINVEDIKKLPIYRLLLKRFFEYKSAVDYFKNHNLQSHRQKAIQDVTKIIWLMKQIREENCSEKINEKEIPQEITPEYIYGYSMKERLEKFKMIIQRLLKEKEQLSKALSSGQSKQILLKYNSLINVLVEQVKNKWIPAPLYKIVTKDILNKVINNEIPENTLILTIGETTYDKQKIFLIIEMKNGNKTKREKVIPIKGNNFNNKKIKWKFTPDEFKSLGDAKINIALYQHSFLCSNIKGHINLKLEELKNKSTIKQKCNIKQVNKKAISTIKITIEIRESILKNEIKLSGKRELIKITQVFKPFK